MHTQTIRSAQDARAVSAAPYAQFMAHRHVYDALAEAEARHGERRALSFIDSPELSQPARSWTYAQFMAEVRRAARLFRTLAGVETPRVAMLLPAIPEAYFTLWGGESAGVVCPINYMLDAAHIAELVQASGANILVALGSHPELDIWGRVPDIAARCPGLRHVLAVGGAPGHADFGEALRQAGSDAGDAGAFVPHRAAGDRAALFHTGGTTGAPKLAQHTHANQLHSAWGAAQMYAMQPGEVILNGFPMFHVAGAFVYGLSSLLSGVEIVLPTLLGLRNARFVQQYWKFVQRHRVTLLAAVPTVIATLNTVERAGDEAHTVRALFTGGSPLPNELAAGFERRHGIPVRNILGMTECAGVVSIEPFLAERVPGSCGIPLPFTEVKAVDAHGRDCAAGDSGILRLRGPHVGPGYTDPARNAGTFEDGWLITGDIGHVDAQGRVFVTGRAKDVIIRGAHNIDPQLIEEALLQHPAVQMAAAVGEPDEYAGELPVAFVSLKPSARVDLAELSAFANARISERPAYPKRIEVLPAIPVTAVGKVFKPRLRALACEHALRERLDRAGLAGVVSVAVEDAARGLVARFERTGGGGAGDPATPPSKEAGEAQEARVAAIMAPFALPYLFDGHPAARSGA